MKNRRHCWLKAAGKALQIREGPTKIQVMASKFSASNLTLVVMNLPEELVRKIWIEKKESI
jgi:hypothetical protein